MLLMYPAVVRRVVDGDTIDVTVDLGFKVHTKQRLRLARINAPETRGPSKAEGKKATAALRDYIGVGSRVMVRTEKTGKYGRYLAEIYLPTGENVNDWMLNNGYAVQSPW